MYVVYSIPLQKCTYIFLIVKSTILYIPIIHTLAAFRRFIDACKSITQVRRIFTSVSVFGNCII